MYLKIKIINDEQVKIKKRFCQIGIFFMQIVSKTVKQVIHTSKRGCLDVVTSFYRW